ncbi:MAG: bifunctional UDP-N-acetylmuramoyl-tripeptide:D-alanyl-D-alanine ligase/alanine racemase [Chitinophagaceae bacterium]|nr:MAG: bifunctional UDP-N-acetylmuramoyl-tripeptide:D-alanyl-D-alanine ligase/alanine racemase [Chitinophagaceae bacterium]
MANRLTYTINDINVILGYSGRLPAPGNVVRHIVIDSRRLYFPDTSIFFALHSRQNDGHDFIPILYEKGVRNFVVSREIPANLYPSANFVIVPHVLAALQQLAAHHRHHFRYPVVGITGSNGKTIVKEWLFQLLNISYNIVRSPKSYNSQVGVPLSVWQMDAVHSLGIFEAGISLPGEMKLLQPVIDPSIGIFTFAGSAHNEGFENEIQKIKEKLLLFTSCKQLVYCADEKLLDEEVKNFAANHTIKLCSWGKGSHALMQVEMMERSRDRTRVNVNYHGKTAIWEIPFTDEASIHNSLTCCATMLLLGISIDAISDRLQQLKPVEMRLELKQGNHNCAVINDSYSADIHSLNIALDFLDQQQQHEKKTLVLSDLQETGEEAEKLYASIAAILQTRNLHRFVGIGPDLVAHQDLFSFIPHTSFHESTEELLIQLQRTPFKDETILLKGARAFRFEKIGRMLEQKQHQTFLEIDLNALRHNLRAYRNLLKDQVKVMAMVKAFSYGSGSFEIASLLQHAGADYLGVAYADEAVELRKGGIRLPIMVMNTEEAGFDQILKHNLEPELYSFNILRAFRNYLAQHRLTHYPVHIKFDSGMHRLGFESQDLAGLCEELAETREFKVISVFSHLAGSSDPKHDAFTRKQAGSFASAAAAIETAIGYSVVKHIANTAAIHRHPDLQMDMVRLGIGLYGIDENEAMQQQLKNVSTLKTTISQIKKLAAGESVGYSRSAIATEAMTIATVRIGYADGYPRLLSNGRGHMLVNGQLAPVVGRVCMDMLMLDISHIDAAEEDEVLVFGEELPVAQLAGWAQTIPYEILTNISQRVRRVYFED